MLRAHLLATTLLVGLPCLPFLVTGFYSVGFLFAVLLFAFAVWVFLVLVSLPYGMLINALMKRCGCTSWWEFLFAGICAGVLMGMLTQVFMVDTAPESNGYVEVYGRERAELFLLHYIQGAIVGLVYAMTYWWVLHRGNRRPA